MTLIDILISYLGFKVIPSFLRHGYRCFFTYNKMLTIQTKRNIWKDRQKLPPWIKTNPFLAVLQWCHLGHEAYQINGSLLILFTLSKFLLRLITKITLTHCISEGKLVTGGFPSQKVNNTESISMSWRHYVMRHWFLVPSLRSRAAQSHRVHECPVMVEAVVYGSQAGTLKSRHATKYFR